MIVIVDNGKGSEEIARFIRVPKQIMKPSEAVKAKASAFILSDGDEKNRKLNIEIVKKSNKPILGIGVGATFVAEAFGSKSIVAKTEKTLKIKVERPHPLVLDMKKMFSVVNDCQYCIEDLPEGFDVFASSSKYDFEIIGHMENPFFGVHFNPEKGGDGLKIIDNFTKFVEVWEKYHKN